MGTVGLSFGSPTSGTGFDVSATVTQIVSNLQKIETPWKNQLSQLQSQDAVISNLGTLYSNLSSDLGQLTQFNGVLAQKTGSSSDNNVLQLTAATTTAAAGAHTVIVNRLAGTSSGYLSAIANAGDTLSGSITLQVGGHSAETISLPAGGGTLASLAAAINTSGVGVRASVLTDPNGSRLSLVSSASGAKGNIAITANSIVDKAGLKLQYSGSEGSGATASSGSFTAVANAADILSGTLTVQVGSGSATLFTVNSSNNTLATLAQAINQAGIGASASVVTNSDGTSSLSLVSGTPGSAGTLAISSNLSDPSPSLMYSSTVTGSDASLTVDGVNLTSASNTVSNLIPGLTFQLLSASPRQSDSSLEPVQIMIANDNAGVETAFNSFVKDYNALMAALNVQEGNDSSGKPEPMFGSPTLSLLQQQLLGSLNAPNPNGFLDQVSSSTNTTLAGKILISAGGGTQHEVDVPTGPNNTIFGLADAINSAKIGVTASVVTKNGQSNLMLQSQTTGSAGELSVLAQIVATAEKQVQYTAGTGGTLSSSTGTLSTIAAANDVLTGSLAIQVGSGAVRTIPLGLSGGSLQDLADGVNQIADLGATAAVSADGKTLTLTAQHPETGGGLIVTSNILDSSDTAATELGYTDSSDVTSLSALGIGMNNDGSLTFDASVLDSLLNTDFTSIVGMFQGVNSWGVNFANMLNSSGSSSSTGILKLAQKSNTSIESTLNNNISKQETSIAAKQKILTDQLNRANQILQALPSQLEGMDQLYSAITGYNQKG